MENNKNLLLFQELEKNIYDLILTYDKIIESYDEENGESKRDFLENGNLIQELLNYVIGEDIIKLLSKIERLREVKENE